MRFHGFHPQQGHITSCTIHKRMYINGVLLRLYSVASSVHSVRSPLAVKSIECERSGGLFCWLVEVAVAGL